MIHTVLCGRTDPESTASSFNGPRWIPLQWTVLLHTDWASDRYVCTQLTEYPPVGSLNLLQDSLFSAHRECCSNHNMNFEMFCSRTISTTCPRFSMPFFNCYSLCFSCKSYSCGHISCVITCLDCACLLWPIDQATWYVFFLLFVSLCITESINELLWALRESSCQEQFVDRILQFLQTVSVFETPQWELASTTLVVSCLCCKCHRWQRSSIGGWCGWVLK